ncbi:hypothetical protein ACFO0M_17435 [Micromonospora mangrovi]|uniref:Uncharacterized protein n=2 Tax=Micromonospora TaxID=1873 RepID=A0AAU7MB56_9ACTN
MNPATAVLVERLCEASAIDHPFSAAPRRAAPRLSLSLKQHDAGPQVLLSLGDLIESFIDA